jgi:hypothetical protein
LFGFSCGVEIINSTIVYFCVFVIAIINLKNILFEPKIVQFFPFFFCVAQMLKGKGVKIDALFD